MFKSMQRVIVVTWGTAATLSSHTNKFNLTRPSKIGLLVTFLSTEADIRIIQKYLRDKQNKMLARQKNILKTAFGITNHFLLAQILDIMLTCCTLLLKGLDSR